MRVMYCGLCDVGNTWKKRLVRTLSRTVHFILGHYTWRVNETPRWHYEKNTVRWAYVKYHLENT